MAEKEESIENVQELIHNKLETVENNKAEEEVEVEEGEKPIDGKFLNKWGAGVAVFSFGFLCIGSFLLGATATTSFLRGLGGAILFGSLFWLVGTMMTQKEDL